MSRPVRSPSEAAARINALLRSGDDAALREGLAELLLDLLGTDPPEPSEGRDKAPSEDGEDGEDTAPPEPSEEDGKPSEGGDGGGEDKGSEEDPDPNGERGRGDTIGPLDAEYPRRVYRRLPGPPGAWESESSRPEARAIREALSQVLAFRAEDSSRLSGGARRGRFDGRRAAAALAGSAVAFRAARTRRLPSVQVGILIDQSGSMGDTAARSGRSFAEEAGVFACGLAGALEGLAGVSWVVAGHQADHPSVGRWTNWAHDPRTARHQKGDVVTDLLIYADPDSVGDVRPFGGNRDGEALRMLAEEMIRRDPHAERRTIIVLSDGSPAACGAPEGLDPIEDLQDAVEDVRAFGVSTYAVGFAGMASTAALEAYYGPGHAVGCHAGPLDGLPFVSGLLARALGAAD